MLSDILYNYYIGILENIEKEYEYIYPEKEMKDMMKLMLYLVKRSDNIKSDGIITKTEEEIRKIVEEKVENDYRKRIEK